MLALRMLLVVLWTMVVVTVRRLRRGPRHPAWSWRVEVLAEVARWASARTVGAPISAVRAALPPAPLPWALRAHVCVEPLRLAGMGGEALVPKGWGPDDPTMLYLHGGGYVLCSPGTHRELAGRIAVASQTRVLTIDYRLAPEHPFPAAIDDCFAAYRALLAEGVLPERLLLGGDSAGGGLCLAMMLRVKDAGEPLPAGAVLLSPWVDLDAPGVTADEHAPFDYVRPEQLTEYAGYYLQDADPLERLASPGRADLAGLPPLLIHTGGAEVICGQDTALAERAREAGVEVTLHVGEGMIHAWHGYARFLPEARRAIREIGQYVNARLGRQSATNRRPFMGASD